MNIVNDKTKQEVCLIPEKGAVSRIIIDIYLIGIIFALLYLGLFAAAFMSALGNPTSTAMRTLEIFGIASFTDNILINLAIWFAAGILISLIMKKTKKSLP
jgi:hypothetical protein